ncbi:GntR family transcriptional regulator [Virgibacillus profundi]|uniref:GntR family transcriptional regulator n=1 Tax=Virgibacillus profundi TaxID=2024555 RepID=A0A2A2IE51_9BACI|nr:FadR/GntR family transcriptional regulator [Virgibacillus profundi]PAV29596.1 GntR family transcriptional regulator [Virgibacillus profundi]PXY53768.1 FadR family transcriptional regulator [Virgibacillus profundi]
MEYKSIRAKKVYEEVADSLLEMLKTGVLKQGDKLDSVDRMAVHFNVSRSTIREALSGLRAKGIVETRQGEGTYITKFDPSTFSIPIETGLLMNQEDIKELNEVRKILEVGAARSATIHHQLEDLKPMEEALLAMEQANGEGMIGEQADLDFHMAVADATHNQMLINLVRSVSDTMVMSMRETRRLLWQSEEGMTSLLREHQLIFEAIKSRQMDLADKNMLSHLLEVEKAQSKYLDLGE